MSSRDSTGGREFVVPIEMGVGQDEPRQGEQQLGLGLPLDRGKVRHKYGLGLSIGFGTSSIEAGGVPSSV